MHDDLLLAAEEPEVAVVVGAREVAGVEPAVAQDLGGRVRVLPVPDGLAPGADPDPADGAVAALAAFFVAHADGEATDGPADRPLLDRTARRVERRQSHFGHAVALVDEQPAQRLELVLELERHLVGTGAAQAQRLEVVGGDAVVAHERGERGRDHGQDRGSVGTEQREDLAGVERPRDHDVRADRQRGQRPEERPDVRHRRTGEEGVGLGELEAVDRARRHPAERVEAVGDALGRTGAAGREEDRRRGAARCGRPSATAPGSVDAQLLERRAVAQRPSDADLQQPARERAGGEVVGAFRVRHDRARAADLERVVDLRRRVAVVERRGDEPGPEAREVVHDEQDAVRHQRRDAVARLPGRAPRSCEPDRSARSFELAPRHPIGRARHRDRVGFGVEADTEEVAQVDRRSELASLERHPAS